MTNTVQSLKEQLSELKANLGAYSAEYVRDFHSGDIEDNARNWAQNRVSVYSYDNVNYYNEHKDYCTNILSEEYQPDQIAEYLQTGHNLYDLITLAGSIGEEVAIYDELSKDLSDIKQVYLLVNLIQMDAENLDPETIGELLDEATRQEDFEDIEELARQALTNEE